MHFLQPELLWALLLAPVFLGLYLWLLQRRRRHVLDFSSLGLLREAMGRALVHDSGGGGGRRSRGGRGARC